MGEGIVEMVFNQNMMIPNELTISTLRYIFVFSLESDTDGSIFYGRIVNEKDLPPTNETKSTRRLDDDEEEVQPISEDKSFNVTLKLLQ